ncbi:MAG: hypothetical protein QXL82_03300 [Candidatus Aenigmatarchaeota archaeon]
MKIKNKKIIIILGLIIAFSLLSFIFIYYYSNLQFYKLINITRFQEGFISELGAFYKYYQIVHKNYNYTFECYIISFNSTNNIEKFNNFILNISKSYRQKTVENIEIFTSNTSEWIAGFLIKDNNVFTCSTMNKDEKALIFVIKNLIKL